MIATKKGTAVPSLLIRMHQGEMHQEEDAGPGRACGQGGAQAVRVGRGVVPISEQTSLQTIVLCSC